MSSESSALDPRLRALYLLSVAIGVFFLPWWQAVGAVAALQLGLWLGLGLGFSALGSQLRKLSLFCALIFVAYALVSEDPATDDWYDLPLLFGYVLEVNLHGVLVGLTMVLRIVGVVMASHVARAGDRKALAAGLRGIGMPKVAALSLDATLSLFGGSGPKGKGDGSGKGGGGGGGGKSTRGFLDGIKRLAKGDVSILAEGLLGHVARVEEHVAATDDGTAKREFIRDVAVISGIALTMLGIKALKLLPGLPFAPGHKGVILIPLYIVAGFMTRSRKGATMTGLTMGTAAFLLGDGRWGVFEIAKHVSPGILVDLLMPGLKVARAKRSAVLWAIFGVVIALGRFATVTVIALSVQAPSLVYAFLLPGLAVHGLFGLISGLVTAPLVRTLDTESENPGTVSTSSDPPVANARASGTGGGGGGGRGRAGGGRGDGSGGGGGRKGHDTDSSTNETEQQ